MKQECFYCGMLQDGDEKCSYCGGRLEACKEEAVNTGEPNRCCEDCGQRLVKISCKLVRYLSEDVSFVTGFGKNKKEHSFRAGSPKYRVMYQCPNRSWWGCRVRVAYFLWPDGTLTRGWY